MESLTRNQSSHLILADIAMAMAVSTVLGEQIGIPASYHPGAVRDVWLGGNKDRPETRQVLALASAGMGPLQEMTGEKLTEQAHRFGVPLDPAEAETVSRHFQQRRDAVLTYRR